MDQDLINKASYYGIHIKVATDKCFYKSGVHLLVPKKNEIEDAIEYCKDNFLMNIYIHSLETWKGEKNETRH